MELLSFDSSKNRKPNHDISYLTSMDTTPKQHKFAVLPI